MMVSASVAPDEIWKVAEGRFCSPGDHLSAFNHFWVASVRRGTICLVKSKLIIAGSAMCIAVVLSSLVKRAREGACEMSCRNTFKTISLALQNYNDAYGTLPPAVTLGADGHAKHSWRALILNYVTAMPSIYDNDQAWDGEKNVRLVNGHVFHFDRPAENTKGIGPYDGPLDFATWFRCCAHQSKIDYSANVVAVTGTQTLWPKI